MDLTRKIILATDLSHHFKILKDLKKLARGAVQNVSSSSTIEKKVPCSKLSSGFKTLINKSISFVFRS